MNLQQFIDDKQQRSAEWVEKKQAERGEIMEMMESSVADITNIPEQYMAYLDLQASTGSRYSAGNAALILAQKPDATTVGTIDHWNKLDRKVTKGESGIRIMAPERYDYMKREQQENPETGEVSTTTARKRGLGMKMMSVFDVSQTTGKPAPEPVRMTGEESIEKGIKALVDLSPVPLQMDDTLPTPAVYDAADMSIRVNGNCHSESIFFSLAREVTHAQLHDGGRYGGYTREGCEFYASSVAHVVCKRFGAQAPSHDFSSVAAEFSGIPQENRREVLDMLHDFSKGMGDKVAQEVGVPVHQRSAKARTAGNAR